MSNSELDFGDPAAERKPRTVPPLAPAPRAAHAPAEQTAGQPAGRQVDGQSAADAEQAAQTTQTARRAVGAAAGIAVHIAGLDWQAIADELNAHGYAILPGLLTADECAAVAAQ